MIVMEPWQKVGIVMTAERDQHCGKAKQTCQSADAHSYAIDPAATGS
jgi:hypothetical protein